MKKLLPLTTALVAFYAWQKIQETGASAPQAPGQPAAVAAVEPRADAFEDWRSGNQVAGAGTVVRILEEDDDGSRHQRFILELDPGHTLLIAHTIDLAPRVDALREGGTVEFNGEYECNDRGGVIHWTHHDPQEEHEAGWLRHNGRIYQ